MREIKFRAWNKLNKKMVYEFGLPTRGVNEAIKTTQTDPAWSLMQYTGLKDKNGVDVYEGDIVRIVHPYKDSDYTGAVTYDRYAFTVDGFYFLHFDTPSDIFSEGTEYIEVIGNQYENPDLLTKA